MSIFLLRAGVGALAAFLLPASHAASDAVTAAAWQRLHAISQQTLSTLARAPDALPALEAGVTEISFREFFAPVVGEGGLEYSARVRALAGKRVRLVGYMVRVPRRERGVFMLSPFPTTIEAQGACFTDDVPPSVVHVHLPEGRGGTLTAFQPGRLAFTGILEIGPQRETDGRNSAVRLRLAEPAGGASGQPPATPASP